MCLKATPTGASSVCITLNRAKIGDVVSFILREGFETFAIHYNGAGQAALYAGRLQSAFEAFERFNPL